MPFGLSKKIKNANSNYELFSNKSSKIIILLKPIENAEF